MDEDRSDDSDLRRVLLEADEFVTRYNLDPVRDVLRTSALSTAGLSASEHLEGLTPAEEKDILRPEPRRKPQVWKAKIFPFFWALFLGCRFCSLSFPYPFYTGDDGPRSRNMLADCAPYISSALFGCWCTPLSNRLWGRRGTMFAGTSCVLVVAVWEVFLPSVYSRVPWLLMPVFGLGIGVTTCTVPIYLAEIIPSHDRGTVSQLIPAAYIGCGIDYLFWSITMSGLGELMLRISVCVSIGAFMFALSRSTESPRWYVAHGHVHKAYQSLRSLRETDISAAQELYSIYTRFKVENQSSGRDSLGRRFVQLFTVPQIRRATLASVVATISFSLSGLGFTGAMFYLAALDTDPEFFDGAAVVLPVTYTLSLFIATICSCGFINEVKRRRLLLSSLFSLSLLFLVFRLLSLALPLSHDTRAASILLCIFAAATAAIGPETVPCAYVAEVFPIYHREFGVALSVAIYQGCQVLLRAFIDHLYRFINPSLVVFVCWLMVFLFMKESKHLTLEDMHLAFQQSTREKVSYRLFTQFVYAFQRYVLRKKVRLQPTEDRDAGYACTPYTDEEAISLAS